MCEIYSRLTIEVPDVGLVSLLLTLNIFGALFKCFLAGFEHESAGWNTLLPNLNLAIPF